MSSFVPYPEQDNPDFNRIIASKKEFAIHTKDAQDTSSSCDVSTRFRLTQNQKIIKGFLSPNTPYNGVLLFHGTGTGKTCSAISMAEQFNKSFTKRHLILVSGNLKDNFKKEIFDAAKILSRSDGGLDLDNIPGCTGSTYVRGIPDRHRITRETLDNKVRRLVNERWQLMAYGELFTEYQKLKDSIAKITQDEALRKKRFERALAELYSDRVVIIDEAHTLRLAGENTKKRVPPIVEHVLRVANNVKLILLTATPMYNYAKEIVYLLSLLLLNDKRIKQPLSTSEFFDNDILTTKGKVALVKYSRGYVSYVSASDPNTFPARLFPSINEDVNILQEDDLPTLDVLGRTLPQSSTKSLLARKLIKSILGKCQIDTYERVRGALTKDLNNAVGNADDEEGAVSRQAIVTALEVSNIAFPSDISFGATGFNSCFIRQSSSPKDQASWTYQPAIKQIHGEFLDENTLGNHASKMKRIIDYILSSEGIVYVYTNYVYNGALPLALALEHVGFIKHGGVRLLKSAAISNRARNMKYIILSANDDISPNNIKEIAAAKSADNTDGSMIKVIIGTSVATEGIDFKAIREVHIMEPWYNFNKLEQVFGRAIRQCSHARLTKEKRNVTIYQHVNVLPHRKTESVDLRVYRIADDKQKSIDEIEGILKSTSIDCLLSPSKPSLVVKNMVTAQGNKIAQHKVESKPTRCVVDAVESSDVDASTFHKRFIEDDVQYAKEEIKKLYKEHHVYKFEDITKKCKISDEVVAFALNDMINQRERILDKRGNVGILDYKSDKYLFQPTGTQYQRLTVEQRAPDAWQRFDVGRMKIDLKMLRKSKIVEKVSTPASSNDDVQTLIASVETGVNAFTKLTQGYKPQLFDFVVDRLDGDKMILLVEGYSDLPLEIKRSIDETGQIYRDGAITYFVNIVSIDIIDYLIMKDKKLMKCGVRETNRIRELEAKRKEGISVDKPIAFVTAEKLKYQFKLIFSNAAKATGTVCALNSKLLKGELISMITDISTDINTASRTKEDLCNIYEIVLRKHDPKHMMRPYIYHLASRKK